MQRVVHRLKDVCLGDASLLPHGRTAGEGLQLRAEVGDLVFDVQDRHRQSMARRERAADVRAAALDRQQVGPEVRTAVTREVPEKSGTYPQIHCL